MCWGLLPYLSCSHRRKSNKCTPRWEMESLTAVCISSRSLRTVTPAWRCQFLFNGKMRLLYDFQMKMFLKCCLQNETWLIDTSQKTIQDCTSLIMTVPVLKEASRIQYLHLKILFKDHFISSQCWKTAGFFFYYVIITPSYWNLTPKLSFYQNYFSTDFRKHY